MNEGPSEVTPVDASLRPPRLVPRYVGALEITAGTFLSVASLVPTLLGVIARNPWCLDYDLETGRPLPPCDDEFDHVGIGLISVGISSLVGGLTLVALGAVRTRDYQRGRRWLRDHQVRIGGGVDPRATSLGTAHLDFGMTF